jgi:ABC-type dipeptide/oligopeptide/nickel transport system permease component
MHLTRYIISRLLFIIPQLFGIILVGFFLLKLIPGDPAVLMLGPFATSDALAEIRAKLGLDRSLIVQLGYYLLNVVQGDLGRSWQTTRPVLEDLLTRFPATLELISLAMLVALLIGLPLGVAGARFKRGVLRKITDYYGLLAGALPDFWVGLVLIFIFYTLLRLVPAPLGRLDISIIPPPMVTGMYIIDSVLAGNKEALYSALSHLILPVMTLGVIAAGPILKMTQSTTERMLESDFTLYAEMCGLPKKVVVRQAVRNALPPVITLISVLYGFLVGGAVLIEIVFSWGGAGQYAVQGVLNADINPVLGFVLFAAVFSLIVYLVVDLFYFAIDPRIRG